MFAIVLLLLLWTAIYTIAFLLCSIVLYAQREQQPIKFRGAWLIFLSSVSCFGLTATHAAIFFRDEKGFQKSTYCAAEAWIEWLCYPGFILPYFLRVARGLWIDQAVARALGDRVGHGSGVSSAAGGAGGDGVGAGRWHDSAVFTALLGGRRYGGGAFARELLEPEERAAPRLTEGQLLLAAFRIGVFLAFIKITVDLAVFCTVGGTFGEQTGGFCTGGDAWTNMMYGAVHLTEATILAKMMRSLKTDWMGARFYRKKEIGIFLVIWVTAALLMGTIAILEWSGVDRINYDFVSFGIMMVRNTLSFGVSHAWIVILSFDGNLAQRHAQPFSNCQALTSLETVLGDITCMQYFREYLISLSQVETLLCWIEIEMFRDLRPEVASFHAHRIWDKFLSPTAALGVRGAP
uniref:RGS domain-containing protein n=1 Tax=Lotharella oceanica TaxID=641309 RepID=A0A7S2TKW5_9EUKA|mmetsp:Transcript_18952/g.35733  ORF Transcript_18952/g.35733 Transcript_18952/m.35733 type:complete len:406 (+) Transcript_18952:36-1253(+)